MARAAALPFDEIPEAWKFTTGNRRRASIVRFMFLFLSTSNTTQA
jgi:hypothetical protein